MKKEPVRNALLEIGMEEMPARFMPPTLAALAEFSRAALADAGIANMGVETFGTPRRIALLIKGIAPRSSDRTDVAVGPPPKAAKSPDGAWTAAATGFAKAQNVPVEKLIIQQTPKGERYVALHEIKGQKTEAVLKEMFPALIRKLTFPKSMIWASADFRFARPVRWFVSLYHGNVVRFKLAGLTADRTTVGLLALGGQKISVAKPEKYKTILQGRCILVDPDDRRKNILSQIEVITKRIKASAIVSPEHLDEVVHLTEYPVSILGHFPEDYLKLPREVLVTVLKKHQKFFPIESAKGQLTNAFIGVRNGPSESQDDVRDGYERVINARFSDAKFFFEKDSQTPLAALVEKLKGIGFHEKIGNMYDKTLRVQALTRELAVRLGFEGTKTFNDADRTAFLSKTDLLTQMVGELPELQGVAGRFYAASEGAEVAVAIEQHYWPLTAEGKLPESDVASLVSVADKMDTLSANFSVGLIPSGSADPYGLRRAAIGVIRILSERRWTMSVGQLIEKAFSNLGTDKGAKELNDFFNQRMNGFFGSQGFRPDEIDAVISANGASVSVMADKLQGLKAVRGRPEFGPLAAAIKRARNVLNQAREKGFLPQTSSLDPSIVVGDQETALFRALMAVTPRFHAALERAAYEDALLELATLKGPIDAFFEGVMVMVDDEKLRSLRLQLLMRVRDLFDSLADFSKLQAGAQA